MKTTAQVEIRLSDVDEMRTHCMHLFQDHWAELRKGTELDIDWHRYYALEEQGALVVLLAWEVDNGPVGYSANVLMVDMHDKVPTMLNTGLYVDPGHRGRLLGSRLIEQTIREAEERHAAMRWHVPRGSDLRHLLNREGLKKLEETWG